MLNLLFVIIIGAGLFVLFTWGFRHLQKDKWQFFATIPRFKKEDGAWEGTNITYYGIFCASAYVFATMIIFVLLGAIQIPKLAVFVITIVSGGFCVPASKIIARIVEKKPHTISSGGANFVGWFFIPWIIVLTDFGFRSASDVSISVIPVMSTIGAGYVLGEGIGRLACMSFGCCYGIPLSRAHPILQKLFEEHFFIFSGKTKKACYAGGLKGQKILPIQAITAVINTGTGLIGVLLFLFEHYLAAYLLPLIVSQVWRFISELLRADFRGRRKISVYQTMGLSTIIYTILLILVLPAPNVPSPGIISGIRSIWSPLMIFFFQGLWVVIFLFLGLSEVTGSTMNFFVKQDKV